MVTILILRSAIRDLRIIHLSISRHLVLYPLWCFSPTLPHHTSIPVNQIEQSLQCHTEKSQSKETYCSEPPVMHNDLESLGCSAPFPTSRMLRASGHNRLFLAA